jgi:hypothetical protein
LAAKVIRLFIIRNNNRDANDFCIHNPGRGLRQNKVIRFDGFVDYSVTKVIRLKGISISLYFNFWLD